MSTRILRPRAGAVITPLHGHFSHGASPSVKHSAAVHAFFPEERVETEEPPPEPQPTDEEKYEVAHRAGFLAGEAAAGKALQTQVQTALREVATMIQALKGSRAKLRRDAEEDVVQLSFNIARRILHRELSADPDAILSLTRLALEKVASREVLKIRVHPSHATALHQLADIAPELIEPDSTLQRGDLLVETARGSLDASVERQLTEIERGFADRLRIGS